MQLSNPALAPGLAALHQPVLPLVRLLQLLFLATPHERIDELVAELTEPIETEGVRYAEPQQALAPFMAHIHLLDSAKGGLTLPALIQTEEGDPCDPFMTAGYLASHRIVTDELERINSLLCGPCGCTLCCTGPTGDQEQLFFEIPLRDQERNLFDLPSEDSPASRAATADHEPALTTGGRPFYESPPGLYHWRRGWSLILPQGSTCPHLRLPQGLCRIYPTRPEVCRRPQIFSYLLEPLDAEPNTATRQEEPPRFRVRNKLLAVWDCPYVQALRDEIAHYGERCGLEPIFKVNKK